MQPTPWTGNTQAAKAIQQSLQKRVRLTGLKTTPQLIGGADISCNRFSKTVYAGIVVLDYHTLQVVERQGVVEEIDFPYIPGYLSFREVPSLLKAWQLLSQKPDVVILDGHGILHPRKMGVASHFALEADVATLGCAKKKLVGEHQPLGNTPGDYEAVYIDDELRGYVLQTRKNARPIYLSPGSGMSCEQAFTLAQHCLKGYRLPEPTRQAHLYVNELRRARQANGDSNASIGN